MARRYDEALDQMRKTLDLNPAGWEAHHWLGLALEQKQRLHEAIAEGNHAIALLPGSTTPMAGVAHAYAKAGETGRALKLLERMRGLASKIYARV